MLEQLYSPFFLSLKIDGMTNIGDGVILEGEDNGTVVLMNHLTGFDTYRYTEAEWKEIYTKKKGGKDGKEEEDDNVPELMNDKIVAAIQATHATNAESNPFVGLCHFYADLDGTEWTLTSFQPTWRTPIFMLDGPTGYYSGTQIPQDGYPRFGACEDQRIGSLDPTDTTNAVILVEWEIEGSTALIASAVATFAALLAF